MTKRVESVNWLTDGIDKADLEVEKALSIISAELRLKRITSGMTQEEEAKLLGTNQGEISRYESGTHNFTLATLIRLCHKLGISMTINIGVDKQ